MNAHEVVVSAVLSALRAAPAVADEIQRGTSRPVGEKVKRAVRVRFGGSTPDRGTIKGAPIDWRTTIIFECHARGAADWSADDALDQVGEQAALELHQAAWQRLFADPTLGGVVMDMEPAPIDLDDEEMDTSVACVRSAVRVLHRTFAYSLEA